MAAGGEGLLWNNRERAEGDVAEDNKRLQEMLHAALRREAEALRRVKHLSELLTECRAGSGTPSSGPDIADGFVAEAQWRRDDWERRPAGWGDGDFDGSAAPSQSSEPMNLSPSLVVSPPLPSIEDDSGLESFIFPGVMSAPAAPLGPLHEGKDTLCFPELETSSPATESHLHSSSVQDGPSSLLVPALHTSGDVRRERERPPPSPSPPPLQPLRPPTSRRASDPAPQPLVSSSKHMSVTLGKISELSSLKSTEAQPAPRSRAQSLLRPSWLRKMSLVGKSKQRSQADSNSISNHFTDFLRHSSHIKPHSLSQYIGRHWADVCGAEKDHGHLAKYYSAVWELFQSETKYLCHQLQPLDQVYKAFLEELQFYGYLLVADVQKIFANLSELVELSIIMASDLFKLFDGRHGDMIAPTNELILAFSMFGHKWNPVYQRFCVNMEQQRGFVKALQQLPNFQEYILVCRGHPTVQRSDLTDLLIAPMQHQCHYQLLLENVLKATSQPSEKSLLTSAIKAFVVALKELQGNITAQQRSEELLELQETLSWPSLASLCPDSYIPEGLSLEEQPCRGHLATPTRQPLRNGTLRFMDSRGRCGNEVQVFLFTDLLLLAEPRSRPTARRDQAKRELIRYTVTGQPFFLDLLAVHALPPSAAFKHCFSIVQRNKLHQLVAIQTLQAASSEDREAWVSSIQQAQYNFCQSN